MHFKYTFNPTDRHASAADHRRTRCAHPAAPPPMGRFHRNGVPSAVSGGLLLGAGVRVAVGACAGPHHGRHGRHVLARARDAVGLRCHHRRGLPADGGRQLDGQEPLARQRAGGPVPAVDRGARGLSGAGPARVPGGRRGGSGLLPVGRRRLGPRRVGDAQPAQCGGAFPVAGAGRRQRHVPVGRGARRLSCPDALLQRRAAVHGGADAADRAPRPALFRQTRRGGPGYPRATRAADIGNWV